jgi:outer membrane protein assembly factor BamE (lipoprotein component of BamABCDE complex)
MALAIPALAVLLSAPLLPQPAQPERPRQPVATPGSPDRSGWRDPASWRRLRVGMSQGEVLRILGDPGRVTAYYGFTRWEYPDALGLRVNFDDRGRLLAWGSFAR